MSNRSTPAAGPRFPDDPETAQGMTMTELRPNSALLAELSKEAHHLIDDGGGLDEAWLSSIANVIAKAIADADVDDLDYLDRTFRSVAQAIHRRRERPDSGGSEPGVSSISQLQVLL